MTMGHVRIRDWHHKIINTTVTGKPLPTSRRIVCHWCFNNGIDCTYDRLKPKRGRQRYRKGLNVFQTSTTEKSSDSQTNNEVTPTPTPPLEYPASPFSPTAPLEIVPAENKSACHPQIIPYSPASLLSSPNSTSFEFSTRNYSISSTASQNFSDAALVHKDSQLHHLSANALNMHLATPFAEPYPMESQNLNGGSLYNYKAVPTTPETIEKDVTDASILFCPIPRKPFSKELRALIDWHCTMISPEEQSIRTSTPSGSLVHRPCVDLFRRSRSTFESYGTDCVSTFGSLIADSKAEAGPPLQTLEDNTPATAYYYTLSELIFMIKNLILWNPVVLRQKFRLERDLNDMARTRSNCTRITHSPLPSTDQGLPAVNLRFPASCVIYLPVVGEEMT
ncbi:hypothetical protein K435DRAFT_804717 [Dendrothele bispora CBS 962.96]|uniref:Uncharacterized protein n=1 Tax=Dendrothele bispora (strain CBS 962.96) TaxID=1314807 RepID=A0A4S8LE40_DENBC|nr:hypothetical protein K435DRAFT_804717 [Dendrothele bispora CBS 962.96]